MMINTERTQLRPINQADCIEFFNYRSDAQANKYQGWIPQSLEEAVDFIEKNPADFNSPDTWFQLAILDKESDKIIGDIGLHFIDETHQLCEIGFTLNSSYQNRGYATEAVSAVIAYLFGTLTKHRISASVDPENQASIRLLERLGFIKEAHFRKSLCLNGVWVDDVVYAILRDDWVK